MASVAIGSLRYDIISDTTQFEQGMVATRKELRQADQAFRASMTPVEKYGYEVTRLDNLLKKGLIDQERYNRAVAALKKPAEAAAASLDKMEKKQKSLATSAKAYTKELVAMGLAYVSLRGAIGAIAEEMQAIDEIAKTSRKLGLLTDELIGIRFAAAELSGMATGQVDMALQRMTRRISEAAAGTGEAKDALKELGLDAAKLNRMGPGQAFREIAEAMKQVGSEQDRLRLSFKLFDSEGAALSTTLAGGSAQIDKMQKRAEELGLTFSDDVAKSVEEANDAWYEMQQAVSGLARTMATELVPAVKAFAGAGQKGMGWYGQILDQIRNQANEGVRTIGNTPGTRDPNYKTPQQMAAEQMGRQREEQAKAEAAAAAESAALAKEMEDAKTAGEEAMKRWAEMDKARIRAQEDQLKAAEAELAAIDKQIAEEKTSGSIGSIGSFGSGSVGEYQFLQAEQRRRQDAAEAKRMADEANRKRQAMVDEVARQTTILEELRDRLEPTTGV